MISFAKIDEIDEIMDFIDKEWRKGHILARNKSFFEWMYVKGNIVNFVISRNDGVIDGILGFVPYDNENSQIALAVWKALKSANGIIGMSMLSFVEKELHPNIIATPGVNPITTTVIYRYIKYEVGKMHHYYRLANRSDFYIPTINDDIPMKQALETLTTVKRIGSYEEYENAGIILANNAIKKDAWYIKRRYFEHPVFDYFHYLIESESKLDVVLREQNIEGHKCIRVVDLLGDYNLLVDFTAELDKIMLSGNYEYVDCYVSGIDEKIWNDAGWVDVDKTKNVIPNYFAPFERTNIDLYYSCKPHGLIILRGDGDQDRPN